MNLFKQDLNLLTAVEALLETRSVSKASERLGVSQPSMSQTLTRIRTAFGDPMFIRVKNEMQPTPRALSVAVAVKQVLDVARQEIYADQTFDEAMSTRAFTLCMTDLAEVCYLPQIVNKILRKAPHTHVRTVSPIAEKFDEGLLAGNVDLAIGYFPDLRNTGVFQQRLLRTTGFACIASAANRIIGPAELTLGTR